MRSFNQAPLSGRQLLKNGLSYDKLFTNIMLNLKIKRLDNLLLWIGWMLMPFGITWIVNPSIDRKLQVSCDDQITRLTILFGLMSQIISGVCLKYVRDPERYSTEIMLTIGRKIILLRAGPDLKQSKVQTQPSIRYHPESADCISEFADRCP